MKQFTENPGPIGVFDSGYGGLTIYNKIKEALPEYDYIYLGDNARTPYGSRSFDIVYQFTRQAVQSLFHQGCHLVILACNTASAKALRTIQQKDLPLWDKNRKVLGIIRPTAEAIGSLTKTNHIGILGTEGTINSGSYDIEIGKLYPEMIVSSQACPMWVPLIENNEHLSAGADYFVEKYIKELLKKDKSIDTLILACTHYPLLLDKIKRYISTGIMPVSQGEYVANSLKDYLIRHPEIDSMCTKRAKTLFYTTESSEKFSNISTIFLHEQIIAEHIEIDR